MRRRSLAALLFCLLALALTFGGCGTALLNLIDPVNLKVHRSTEYYDVRGATSGEILEYLETHSLADAQGRRLAGTTASSWRLEWSTLPQSASCYFQKIILGLNLVLALPAPQIHRQKADKVHRQFHVEDAARRQAERTSIQAQIDANRGRLAVVESEIWGLDRTLSDLGHQLATAQDQGGAVEMKALAVERRKAVSRKATLEQESAQLKSLINRLTEKYKFTW